MKMRLESFKIRQAMDVKPSEETRRFLRQFFLIRYNSLLERIKQKIPMPIQIQKDTANLISVAWIDDALYEVKAVPSLY